MVACWFVTRLGAGSSSALGWPLIDEWGGAPLPSKNMNFFCVLNVNIWIKAAGKAFFLPGNIVEKRILSEIR